MDGPVLLEGNTGPRNLHFGTGQMPGGRSEEKSVRDSDANLDQTRVVVFRPVTVEAITTSTAATAIAMSQRTQSIPGLPLPPKAV
jgi:hypothetical protein